MSHALLPTAVNLLTELVSFNSESSLSNLPLVERIREYLSAAGLPVETRLDESGEKASLLATLGPAVGGGVVLSGHTDVVDAVNQRWQTPPFELREQDGRLYGRGSCDMKGFIACVLAQVPAFAAANLKTPAHIALSRDEELGCIGMPDMLDMISKAKISPSVAIVGEPTSMRVVAGHKGGCEVRTVFTGTPAHSGSPSAGSGAVVPAARFVVFLAELEEEMRNNQRAESMFNPPHGLINAGILRGGEARNIVPGNCEVMWHYRTLPEEDAAVLVGRARDYAAQKLLPAMRAGGHFANIEMHIESEYPGLSPDADSPAVKLAQTLLGESSYAVAPYGADAGHFQRGGIPAVLVGPGDIAQAHKPDEFIALSEMERCLCFLDDLRGYLSQ